MAGTPENRQESLAERYFNETECIRTSLNLYKPNLFSFLGEGISLTDKFLSEEVIEATSPHHFQLKSVNRAMRGFKQLFKDRGLKPSGDNFDQIGEEANAEQRRFGGNVLAKAEGLSLVRTISVEEAAGSLQVRTHGGFQREVEYEHTFLKSRGWQVYPNQENEAILVTLQSEEEQQELKAVNIDRLYETDPKFVKRQIRNFFRNQAIRGITNSVTYNLMVHRVSESDLFPQVIRELGNISSTEDGDFDRLTETLKVQAYLILLTQYTDFQFHESDGFVRGLPTRNTKIESDSRQMYPDYYLQHMATCPGETEQTRLRAGRMENTYNILRATRLEAPYHPIPDTSEAQILRNPIQYTTQCLDDLEQEIRQGIELDRNFLTFLDKTRGKMRFDQIVEILQETNPLLYEQNIGFQEALGEDYAGKSNYDRFLKDGARDLFFETIRSTRDKAITLEDVKQSIAHSLYVPSGNLHGDNEWTRRDHSNPYKPKTVITDETLRDLNTYLVMKRLENEERDRDSTINSQTLESLFKDFKGDYQKKIGNSNIHLDGVANQRVVFQAYLDQYGIPISTVSQLVEISKLGTTEEMWNRYDYAKFSLLFRTLAYSRRGYVEPKSPIFQSLVRELFPKIKEEEWDIIREAPSLNHN